jgi:hypothetical protein
MASPQTPMQGRVRSSTLAERPPVSFGIDQRTLSAPRHRRCVVSATHLLRSRLRDSNLAGRQDRLRGPAAIEIVASSAAGGRDQQERSHAHTPGRGDFGQTTSDGPSCASHWARDVTMSPPG